MLKDTFYSVIPVPWSFQLFLNFIRSQTLTTIITKSGFCQKQTSRGILLTGDFKNSAKFTGKHLCRSLIFNRVADLRPGTLLKETPKQLFPVNFAENLRTFLIEHLPWAASILPQSDWKKSHYDNLSQRVRIFFIFFMIILIFRTLS